MCCWQLYVSHRFLFWYLNFAAKNHHRGRLLHFTLMNTPVKKATLLATGEDVPFEYRHEKASGSNRVVLALPEKLPFEYYNTIDLQLADEVPAFGTLDSL